MPTSKLNLVVLSRLEASIHGQTSLPSILIIGRWEEFETAVPHAISAKTREGYYNSIVELKNNFNSNDGTPFLTPVGASTIEIDEVTTREVERKAVWYVLRQWLNSNNEYIEAAWIDRYFHCGITFFEIP
ncbi:hypothetical protein K3495_g10792 [Podosphaera aphanis]|nr:hypothetical protein K3495_g10792 [Podosphaera aphanis]